MTALEQNFEPVKIDTSTVIDEERVPLFYIDDTEYTVPKKVRPNVVIKYLNDVIDRGPEFALASAMDEVLGTDAMQALGDCESVTDEQMDQIMSLIEKMMLSASKNISGKSRRARRR